MGKIKAIIFDMTISRYDHLMTYDGLVTEVIDYKQMHGLCTPDDLNEYMDMKV